MLTEREKAMLDLERSWWKIVGSKENRIRETFGWSMTTYYQVLNALIDRSDAAVYDPMLIDRLKNLRRTRMKGSDNA